MLNNTSLKQISGKSSISSNLYPHPPFCDVLFFPPSLSYSPFRTRADMWVFCSDGQIPRRFF